MKGTHTPLFDGAEKEPDKKRRKEPKLLDRFSGAINRKKAPRPGLSLAFRALWIAISKCFPGWKQLAQVMQPATVGGWHRRMARFM